jgi:methionyl-tRNA formyltransferase
VLFAKAANLVADKIRARFAVYNKPENKTDFGEEGRRLFCDNHCATLYTSGINDINAPENVAWLRKMKPDVVAVCGASIFRDEILSVPSKGVLNLHGGLSQQYRGLFTTDWAIYNEEPEYVGATVHYVSHGIDDGNIVYQGRPEIDLIDNPHSLYVKVVKLGINMMEKAIMDIADGTIKSTVLSEKGDLYLASMFTSRKRDATWGKLRKGVIRDYLSDKESRDKKVLGRMINNYHNISRAG